jgi:PAS domain S-box-containing protein
MATEHNLTAQDDDILVVDDEIASLRLLAELLTGAGYQVRAAERPQLALEAALAQPPSLILLDVKMPEMSGFEVCHRLKQDERTRGIPIIFVSALDQVRDQIQGFEAGGVDFISKPFQELEVLARVKTHLQLRDIQLHLEDLVSERTAELTRTNETLLHEISERQRAQSAMQVSEEKYRTLVEQAQDGIVVLQGSRIQFANPAAVELFGYTPDELLNTVFTEYIFPDELAKTTDIHTRRMRGESVPPRYESAVLHKDGSRVEVEFSAGVTLYSGEPASLVMIRDITERKRAEQELQASQRLLSLVIDNVPALVSYVDDRQQYRFVNQRYEQSRGIPRSEFVGKPVQEILGPAAYATTEGHIAAVLAGERVSYEDVFDYPDSRSRWMSIDYVPDRDHAGDVQGFVGLITDITERKRAESQREALLEDLRRSKERLEEAQRTAQIGDWEYDIQAGKITWSNEMYRIFDVDPQQYVPNAGSDEEFCHPDDASGLRKAFNHFFASAEPLDLDYRIVTPQSAVKHCRRRGRLILDDQGIPSHAIGTTEDITQRKLVEQQILEYQQRLQSLASQLTLTEERERRRIARELHDEVGQRLTFARMGLASAREVTSEAKREAILNDVSQSVRQAIGDIRDLIFELSSPLLDEVGLAAGLSEWLQEQVARKHGIETEFIHDGRQVLLDDDVRAMVFRSVRELLTNVVKHAQAKRVMVRLEGEGTQVRIVVEDDGLGFDTNAVPKTMGREGGFGLFSIQERMAALGGSLALTSEPGQGCKAVLTAPATIDRVPE